MQSSTHRPSGGTHSLLELFLIGRILGTHTENIAYTQVQKLFRSITERTCLRCATSSAWNLIPFLWDGLARCSENNRRLSRCHKLRVLGYVRWTRLVLYLRAPVRGYANTTVKPDSVDKSKLLPAVEGRFTDGNVLPLRWSQAPSSAGLGISLGNDCQLASAFAMPLLVSSR